MPKTWSSWLFSAPTWIRTRVAPCRWKRCRRAYDSDKNFKMLMDQMDIKRDEMEVIFHVLDSDNSGNLSYLEFCKNLGSFFKRDPIIMHSLVQCTVLDVKKLIQKEVVSVMREQHAEMMREQRKLLAAFGLLAGSEPRDVPVPAPKAARNRT